MGFLHRYATAGVLLVALLLTGGPQSATAGEPDARGGVAARVPGKGSDLVAAAASEWWRAPADRRDPHAPRQPRQLQLGTAAAIAVLGTVLAWLAALPAPRRARPLRPLAPSGARSPPAPRLA
jgi:hypothetical protein